MSLHFNEVKQKIRIIDSDSTAAMLVLGISIFVLWWAMSASVSFWDDTLLSSPAMTTEPASPLLFFLPTSEFYKSWPVTATLIWLGSKIGMVPTSDFKIIIWVLHLFNAVLVSHLFPRRRFLIFAFYICHPVSYLTLSWAFQFSSQLAMTLALSAWLIFERSMLMQSVRLSLAATALLALSILTKPWAVILIVAAFYKCVQSIASQYISGKPVKKMFVVFWILGILCCGGLGYRALQMAQPGLSYFPNEMRHKIEFETGARLATDPDPLNDDQYARLNLPLDDFLIRKSLFVGESMFRYLTMSLGISKFEIIQPRPSKFDVRQFLGLTVMATGLIYLMGSLPCPFDVRRGLLWYFAGWIPVSGLFYLPHMKFSFTSPHYAVLMLPGVAMLVGSGLERINTGDIDRKIGAGMIGILAAYQAILYWKLNHP